jgi:hypothetical protein
LETATLPIELHPFGVFSVLGDVLSISPHPKFKRTAKVEEEGYKTKAFPGFFPETLYFDYQVFRSWWGT